ncbi:hypothetical protein COCNU_02G016720 [Cocos nucifera]|uniref:Uncharacterized protein n=1 Tax=Cocos nucifera TaxID=13894 RepID=A0A8K0I0S2_COCNU|nr:hypothetical protein COCNU_02G016720 [Cocos nucifera]
MGSGLIDHDGTEMPSSFHPCPSAGYARFSIRGAVEAYSVHLGIGYQGPPPSASTPPMTSTPSTVFTPSIVESLPLPIFEIHATTQASECALSSQIFCGSIRMAHMWNRQYQRMYDFFDHERARDVRLKKIEELYWDYKVKLHREWLEHR